MQKGRIPLDDDELETILIVARNGQSGRITKYEVDELVRNYRETKRLRALLRATASLAWALADDESGIDNNETYKAAIAASKTG